MQAAATALQRLCGWATALRFAEIPPHVAVRIADVCADTIACATAAACDAELEEWLGSPVPRAAGEAHVLGSSGVRLPRAEAARRNAIQANWLQLDEGHHRLMCHAGIYTVLPALSECEAQGHTLGEFLRAVAAGYEVCCRLASAWSFQGMVPHPHALWSGLGAVATLAVLRRQSGPQLLAALQHAATLAMVQPFAHVAQGAMASNLWVGQGVERAFDIVRWTAAGLPAPDTAIASLMEGVLATPCKPGHLHRALGEEWAVEHNYHKLLACGGQSHAAMEAVLAARRSLAGTAAGHPLAHLHAEVHAFGLEMAGREPATGLAARFSIPHLMAVGWLHGRTDAAALGPAFLHDPLVADLRRRIHLSERLPALPAPHHRAARVTVTLPDGSTTTTECLAAQGSSAYPLARETLARKCRELSGGRHAALIERLLHIDSQTERADSVVTA